MGIYWATQGKDPKVTAKPTEVEGEFDYINMLIKTSSGTLELNMEASDAGQLAAFIKDALAELDYEEGDDDEGDDDEEEDDGDGVH